MTHRQPCSNQSPRLEEAHLHRSSEKEPLLEVLIKATCNRYYVNAKYVYLAQRPLFNTILKNSLSEMMCQVVWDEMGTVGCNTDNV